VGREFRLAAPVVKVGRDPQFCDFALHDDYVSNPHFSIRLEQTRFFIVDEGSTNGTRLNGVPIPPQRRMPLQPEAIIEAGNTRMQFKRVGGTTRQLKGGVQPPAAPPTPAPQTPPQQPPTPPMRPAAPMPPLPTAQPPTPQSPQQPSAPPARPATPMPPLPTAQPPTPQPGPVRGGPTVKLPEERGGPTVKLPEEGAGPTRGGPTVKLSDEDVQTEPSRGGPTVKLSDEEQSGPEEAPTVKLPKE
jgi:pSer/pThr/pTyr-binding forkhead associated (FHA) protein